MKRKEMVDLLEKTNDIMDFFSTGYAFGDRETNEIVVVISAEEVDAIRTTLAFCAYLIDGKINATEPKALMEVLMMTHAILKFDLHEDSEPDQKDSGEC